MKILVIGGSYFLGRVFVMLTAGEHELTVVNRGNQSLAGLPVREIHGDRRDTGLWESIAGDYDAVVDFCAYQAGDIRRVVEYLAGRVKQYIFISTVDVYAHGDARLREEKFPFEIADIPGETGEYISGKVALERELVEVCGGAGIHTTVLRPALIYGPMNYAPRETLFIRIMAQKRMLPVITDADGRFQFLYVKDGAEAVRRCIMNEKAFGQAFNLCGDEIVDHKLLAQALRRADEAMARRNAEEAVTQKGSGEAVMPKNAEEAVTRSANDMKGGVEGDVGADGIAGEKPLQEIEISVGQAQAQGFPLPFAVQETETHLCSNEKSKRELGMIYTPLDIGMDKTYRAFYPIFKTSNKV